MAKKQISPEIQAIISATDAGHFATSVALLNKFLADNAGSQRGWLDLGHALAQLARYDESDSAFQKAIELADGDSCDVIFGQIGNLYKSKGDLDSAASWYQQQIEADPTDATGYVFLANIQMRQSKFGEAEKTLESALQCEQGCLEEVHYSLGLLYRSIDRLVDARTQLEKAVALDKNYVAAKTALKDVKSAISLTS